MTSSLYSDGPPLASPSPSSQCDRPSDATSSLSYLSLLIQQLSSQLLFTSPSPVPSASPWAPVPSPLSSYTHGQLVCALSNVVFVALRSVSSLPLPLPAPTSPAAISVQGSGGDASEVSACSLSSPPPAPAAPLPPLSTGEAQQPVSSPPRTSTTTSSRNAVHRVRVLTQIQKLPALKKPLQWRAKPLAPICHSVIIAISTRPILPS